MPREFPAVQLSGLCSLPRAWIEYQVREHKQSIASKTNNTKPKITNKQKQHMKCVILKKRNFKHPSLL